MDSSDLEMLKQEIRVFVAERDWEKFNTPKNLATSVTIESAELLELFQWLQTGSVEELREERYEKVKQEIADVLIYLISLSDQLDIDIKDAVLKKMTINRVKYPVGLVRGSALKYTEYG
jgi:NTP pyrophosphatase (non-canonical NTP hydrolase)